MKASVGIARARGIDPSLSGQTLDLGKQIQYAMIGSGVMIDPSGIVVTAKHVVQKWAEAAKKAQQGAGPVPDPLFAVLGENFESDGGSFTGQYLFSRINFVRTHNQLDLALARIPLPPDKLGGFPTLPLTRSPCEDGDEIGVCGFPLGGLIDRLHATGGGPLPNTPTFSQGIVSAAMPYFGAPENVRNYFRIDALLNRGNSGGPVFDIATGRLVGIVTDVVSEVEPYSLVVLTDLRSF